MAAASVSRIVKLPRVGSLVFGLLVGVAACAMEDVGGSDVDFIEGGCESAHAKFLAGEVEFSVVRATCNKDVDDYNARQAKNFDGFKNSPLGLSGPPLGLLLAIMDDEEIWPKDTLGLYPDPHPDNEDHPNMGLPYGMVYQKNPTTHLRHVFFSCGGCHTGRVIGPDDEIQMIYGAPNTEVEAQGFGWRVRLSVLGVPGGKEGFAKAELDANGDYVFDDDGFPKFELTPSGKDLKGRAIDRARNLPGRFQGDTTEWGIYQFKWGEIMKKLVFAAVKTDTMYYRLQRAGGAYPGDAKSPKHAGPRPGMMDAYGFAQGLTFIHAMRDDYFARIKARYGANYAKHPFFEGLVRAGQRDEDLFAAARERIRSAPGEWLAKEPAPVDVKSLFHLDDRGSVGWDGNQATSARVLASGLSAVGDPWNVNLPIHEGMGEYIGKLPAAAYPFEVDGELAREGAPIFERSCAGCHEKGNATTYPLSELETDPNRANVMGAIGRAGLVELLHQACDATGDGAEYENNITIDPDTYERSWCEPNGSLEQQDDEFLREAAMRGKRGVGYKADDLRGIWIQAPYLHNGSVPTLWHLLNPDERPKKFARGNINFDREKVGFEWKDMSPSNYRGAHVVEYDTSLRGQSNAGHTFGAELGADEKRALVEFLKTL